MKRILFWAFFASTYFYSVSVAYVYHTQAVVHNYDPRIVVKEAEAQLDELTKRTKIMGKQYFKLMVETDILDECQKYLQRPKNPKSLPMGSKTTL